MLRLRLILTNDGAYPLPFPIELSLATHSELRAIGDAFGDWGFVARFDQSRKVERAIGVAGDRCRILERLFLHCQPVAAGEAERLLGETALRGWRRHHLARIAADRVQPLVRIDPYAGRLFASDLSNGPRQIDRVMAVSGSSITLAEHTVRTPVDSALDIGVGCGLQAIMLSEHSRRTTATDRNPRALRFTRLNAALNGARIDELREGSLLEPAQHEQYDLIVCNAPFVVSPDQSALYRDSGERLDTFCRRLVSEAIPRLRPGGRLQVLVNWVHIHDEDWQARLASWWRGGDVGAWVLRSSTRSPEDYTEFWLRGAVGEQLDAARNRWLTFFEQERVSAISTGLITVEQQENGVPWTHFSDAPKRACGPVGEEVAKRMNALAAVETWTDDELLNAKLTTADGLELHETNTLGDDGWREAGVRLRRSEQFISSGRIDRTTAQFLAKLRGRETLQNSLREFSAERGLRAETSLAPILTIVRRLLVQGFLQAPARQLISSDRSRASGHETKLASRLTVNQVATSAVT
ncbi:MAG: methyltransferase [Pirellulaceae bacterium]|nr:methyltransferase [Pirellulaceae bacterium]MDP7014794.1 methyltransferase [Pirellulaceae bacterium]